MYGPQVVKTAVKPSTAVSPAARQAALALNGLIEIGEDPAVLEARGMAVHQVVVMLLTTAGKFHEGEASLEEILGALTAGAAWIAHHHAYPH
ncbi:MAG: hypothetical protein ABTS22_17475 [Accumulibacter sp.]|uniref:hypothetical protein n=1 Tax=Accumulibacter sp. TaxID=2053492 RepID=UPI0033153084